MNMLVNAHQGLPEGQVELDHGRSNAAHVFIRFVTTVPASARMPSTRSGILFSHQEVGKGSASGFALTYDIVSATGVKSRWKADGRGPGIYRAAAAAPE